MTFKKITAKNGLPDAVNDALTRALLRMHNLEMDIVTIMAGVSLETAPAFDDLHKLESLLNLAAQGISEMPQPPGEGPNAS